MDPKDDKVLNAAREWLAAEPPGLERADKLAIPRLPIRNPQSAFRNRHWVWQIAAAAAIFVGGIFVGRIGSTGTTPAAPDDRNPNIVSYNYQQATPTPTPTPTPVDRSLQLSKAAPPPRYVTRQGDRVIIETTLADSGAHATWVIDGNLKLASNDTSREAVK